ncbi:hypothetical protein [Kutzneria sp. CA-103260]|uniref:hypothetical protein n=1 Tax=Kutzneria sp. CA-103260 TaxID=2802641 RepID=UPI001BAC9EA5|nr:hypothetical protein [Kutzneria sp. CA-103260]QUQ72568.1 hypothetical protein JJ691_103570 [Kutzneria sp. CA-103260]
MPEIFIARLRPEFARGERERCCHLFPVPLPGAVPRMLHAYCGQQITPGQAELLDGHRGMPCVTCISVVAARSARGEAARDRCLP